MKTHKTPKKTPKKAPKKAPKSAQEKPVRLKTLVSVERPGRAPVGTPDPLAAPSFVPSPLDSAGHAKLRKFIQTNYGSVNFFCKSRGVPQATVAQILKRSTQPSFATALKLAEVTDNHVKIEDWASAP